MTATRNQLLYGRVVNWAELETETIREGVARSAYSTDQVMLCMNDLAADMTLNPHVHEGFDQLAYIIDGTADYYIGSVAHRMSPGSMLLVPAGSEHHIEPVTPRVVNLDIFVPPRQDLEHLLRWIGQDGPR